jgi:hypothetical protein
MCVTMSAVEKKDEAAEAEMSVAAAAETGEIAASDAVKPSVVAAAKSVKRECGSATTGESPVPAKRAKTVDTDNGTIARDTATQGPDSDAPEIDEGVYSSAKNGVAGSVKDLEVWCSSPAMSGETEVGPAAAVVDGYFVSMNTQSHKVRFAPCGNGTVVVGRVVMWQGREYGVR